jgi:hypothetical protein
MLHKSSEVTNIPSRPTAEGNDKQTNRVVHLLCVNMHQNVLKVLLGPNTNLTNHMLTSTTSESLHIHSKFKHKLWLMCNVIN